MRAERGGVEYTADDIEVWPRRRVSTQRIEDVPVVATSLAELLTRVLDAGGSVDLPPVGRLIDHLPPWRLAHRLLTAAGIRRKMTVDGGLAGQPAPSVRPDERGR